MKKIVSNLESKLKLLPEFVLGWAPNLKVEVGTAAAAAAGFAPGFGVEQQAQLSLSASLGTIHSLKSVTEINSAYFVRLSTQITAIFTRKSIFPNFFVFS